MSDKPLINRNQPEIKQDSIVIFKPKGGKKQLDVRLKDNTIWLRQEQIAELFGTKRPAITKHLQNIFHSNELSEKAVCSILERTASDGKRYKTRYYTLDAIISIGYRVNSKRATDFRIWATNVLRKYLTSGYVLNERKLLKQSSDRLFKMQKTINLVCARAALPALRGMEQELFSIIGDYATSLQLLYQYDEKKLFSKGRKRARYRLTYEESIEIIAKIRAELVRKKEASVLFGSEVGDKFKGALGSITQTFDGYELYHSLEEKAAHLLYLIIKDHPFVDGNKRIGSILFIYYLDKNHALFTKTGERAINDTALTALALLIAVSEPKEKDVMISLIMRIIAWPKN
ncbi:hypothetical protein A2311_04055 [candidate division WOR-1 bacterium RIFOXYB2_FULL_48_7]|uniref:Fido domain-containing protein n=1 Tax=candidate division WOR-1 bacterium RIFOXYB2_FULL_48_7 TaxID=1802583 RepID=A0A1F4TVF5_UNCSA|nr:MAG: hypothetical protein A2311_04055 [candidate division WOR-1 bacterium RIFOXYB2_FULL_48_7]